MGSGGEEGSSALTGSGLSGRGAVGEEGREGQCCCVDTINNMASLDIGRVKSSCLHPLGISVA